MTARLIVGWGNPVVGDDGFGWRAIDLLEGRLHAREDIDLRKSSTSGMRLVEAFLGYDEVILIDAAITGEPVGTVARLDWSSAGGGWTDRGGHDEPFLTALARGRTLAPDRFPRRITVYRCAIERETQWRDGLSPAVEAAAHESARRVLEEIEEGIAVG